MKESIVEAEQVHMNTVNRWIQFNDDALTKASILAIIKRFTGLTEDQLLEPVSHEPVKV